MFNLIRRDVFLQKGQLLLYIPLILLFVIAGFPPALILIIASVYIPFNAYIYDGMAETNILLNSLPYTRTEIIASRYLGAIVYMILSIGLTGLALLVFNVPFTLTDIAIGSGLSLIFVAFTFPLFNIFKPSYIFTIALLSLVFLSVIGPPIVMFLAEHLTTITNFIVNTPNPALYTGAAIVVLPLYAISWLITTMIYQRKAF